MLYCDYNGLKLYCSTEEALEIVQQIMSLSDANIGTVIDVSMIQNLLGNITTEETSSGAITTLKLPVLNEVVIYTNKDSILTAITANNIQVGTNYFALQVSVSNMLSAQIGTPTQNEYVNFAPTKDIINGIFTTYKQLPIRLAGTVSIGNISTYANIKIDKSFNLEATFSIKGQTAKVYIVDGYAYINYSNINAKISVSELLSLVIGSQSQVDFSITDIKTNSISFGSLGSIILNYNNDGSIRNIAIDSPHISADFSISMTSGEIYAPNPSTVLNAKDIKTIYSKYSNYISEDYSISINSAFGTNTITGAAYINTKNFKTFSTFCFAGTINNYDVFFALLNNTYYLEVETLKMKFENGSLSAFLDTLIDSANIKNVNTNDLLLDYVFSIKSASLSKAGALDLTFADSSSLSVKPFTNEIEVSLNSFALGNSRLNASVSICPNNKTYASYLRSIQDSEYVDCSNSDKLVRSLLNTLNSTNYSLSGSLDITYDSIELCEIKSSITFQKANNQQRIIVNLDNIPTTALITPYNSIGYKKQSATIILEGTQITVNRYLHHRFSDKKTLTFTKTMKISDLQASDLCDIVGIKSSLMPSSNGTTSSADLSILELISVSDSELLAQIRTSKLMNKLSDCQVAIKYENLIDAISLNLTFGSSVNISLNLD